MRAMTPQACTWAMVRIGSGEGTCGSPCLAWLRVCLSITHLAWAIVQCLLIGQWLLLGSHTQVPIPTLPPSHIAFFSYAGDEDDVGEGGEEGEEDEDGEGSDEEEEEEEVAGEEEDLLMGDPRE